MMFFGIDDQTVELKITNYQYPNVSSDWDGNWLLIYIKVKSKLGHWQTVDASLTTWEVQSLINWFDSLSRDLAPEYSSMEFTEPNLSFELVNLFNENPKQFKIKFDLESRPQSAKDDIDYFVVCDASNTDLRNISDSLIKELERFPQRN